MAEASFYHLTARPLEAALPELLSKTIARGWRAIVRVGTPERLEHLDRLLWTFREDAFLPHGSAADGRAERQPIWLTTGADRPNGAQALFLIDGAETEAAEASAFTRVALMFDGRDPDAVAAARRAWKALSGGGLACVYWAETEGGRFEKRAEVGAKDGRGARA